MMFVLDQYVKVDCYVLSHLTYTTVNRYTYVTLLINLTRSQGPVNELGSWIT